MAKMFEDAFRAIGILEDDAPKFVARSILEVIAIPSPKGKKGAAPQGAQINAEAQDHLEITITPYDQSR